MAVSLSISITQNSQSVANNKSNVTVKVNYSWTYGSFNRDSTTKYVKINGTKYSFNDADINPNASTSGSGTLFTKTLDISHNADGTGKVEVYAYVDTDISSGVLTKSASKTLTTIPRSSTISATSAYVENQSTITVSRKSTAFTHTITWACGSASGTVATKSSSTSIKWTLPTSLYAQIGSTATQKKVTLTCKTYKGDSQIGDSKTCTLYAKTSASRNGPILSPTVTPGSDTQGLTGNTTSLIKGWSSATVAFGASAQDSATLKSKKVTNSGGSLSGDGIFTSVTSGTFTFTATDSRGYSKTVTKTLTLINWFKPSCKLKVTIGLDGKASIRITGSFFNGSFGAKTNALNIQFRYKVSGGSYSSWINPSSAAPSGNSYTATHTLTGLDYTKTYYFQARAIDLTDTSATTAETKVRSYPVWDWGESSFHVHGSLRIDNNKALSGKNAAGTSQCNMAYISPENNLVLGGGSYPPNNVYINPGGSNSVYVGNDDEGTWYNVLGAMKALCNTHTFEPTITAGSNYQDCSASCTLVGNCFRLGVNATRKTAASVGNITNEEIMTITFNHGGKIDVLYRVDFPNGTEGGLAGLDAQTTTDGDTTTIKVRLCSTTTELLKINAYTCMPANIYLPAFV